MATYTIITLNTCLCDRCATTGLDTTVPFTRCDCGGAYYTLQHLAQQAINDAIPRFAHGLLDTADPTRLACITDLAHAELALRALDR